MNAPANILPPHLAPYAKQIATFLNGVEGKELELRCRLLSARNTATLALSRQTCSEDAAGVIQQIECLTGRYAYTAMPLEKMETLWAAIRRLMSAVGCLDDFDGGLNARG